MRWLWRLLHMHTPRTTPHHVAHATELNRRAQHAECAKKERGSRPAAMAMAEREDWSPGAAFRYSSAVVIVICHGCRQQGFGVRLGVLAQLRIGPLAFCLTASHMLLTIIVFCVICSQF